MNNMKIWFEGVDWTQMAKAGLQRRLTVKTERTFRFHETELPTLQGMFCFAELHADWPYDDDNDDDDHVGEVILCL
jgi:hypothetical protein